MFGVQKLKNSCTLKNAIIMVPIWSLGIFGGSVSRLIYPKQRVFHFVPSKVDFKLG